MYLDAEFVNETRAPSRLGREESLSADHVECFCFERKAFLRARERLLKQFFNSSFQSFFSKTVSNRIREFEKIIG